VAEQVVVLTDMSYDVIYDWSILLYTSVASDTQQTLKREAIWWIIMTREQTFLMGTIMKPRWAMRVILLSGLFLCAAHGCDHYVLLSGLDVLGALLNKVQGSSLLDCVQGIVCKDIVLVKIK